MILANVDSAASLAARGIGETQTTLFVDAIYCYSDSRPWRGQPRMRVGARVRRFQEPQIAVINGMVKDHMTEPSDAEYRTNVRKLGEDYLETLPRRIANSDDD